MNIKNVIKWVLTGLVSIIFIGTGLIKLSGSSVANEMANGLEISIPSLQILGILELSAALLLIIPRTGLLGFSLLAAYMGGAISAHLITGESLLFPILIQVVVWVTAAMRFPELTQRIQDK